MIKYETLEKNVNQIVNLIGKKTNDPEIKSFVKNSQFYIIINPKFSKTALARTTYIYLPNPKYLHPENPEKQQFHYTRPGGADRVFKINPKTSWIFKIEFSEMFLKHAGWTDIKAVITHELSHDFDFYTSNGKGHNHNKVFVDIYQKFRKLVGIRSTKTKGFITEKAEKSWSNEMKEKSYQIEVKKRKKEEISKINQYVLTMIYNEWYPTAEKHNTISFDDFWEYVKEYFHKNSRLLQSISNKTNLKIRLNIYTARYWYENGNMVTTLVVPVKNSSRK